MEKLHLLLSKWQGIGMIRNDSQRADVPSNEILFNYIQQRGAPLCKRATRGNDLRSVVLVGPNAARDFCQFP